MYLIFMRFIRSYKAKNGIFKTKNEAEKIAKLALLKVDAIKRF